MHTAEPCDWIHHTKECHGAQRGGDEHRYDRALRTERTTDECHERYVAKSHSLALERHFAEPTDNGDHARAGACTDQCLIRSRKWRHLAEKERDDRRHQRPAETEQSKAIGNEIGLEVGHRDPQQHRAEYRTRSAANVGPKTMTDASHPKATIDSMIGYIGEMDSVQHRQRARRTSQLAIGMF